MTYAYYVTKRLSVNINDETAQALETLSEVDDITVTEVVRKAVSVYTYLVTEIDQGMQLQLRHPENGQITYVRMI